MDKVFVDAFYNNLISKLPKPVGKRVRELFEQDENAFMKAANEALPSQQPGYWAKPSCKKCHGRGFTAINYHTQEAIRCSCVQKNYLKWMRNFRLQFLERETNEEQA